jgi:hypothetical protein
MGHAWHGTATMKTLSNEDNGLPWISLFCHMKLSYFHLCMPIYLIEPETPHCRLLTVPQAQLHRYCTSLLLAAAMDHSSDDDDCFSVQLDGTNNYPKAPKVIIYTIST